VAQDGQEIAGYKLLKKIGEGGMGQVFLAEQLRLRRQVAVKLVHLDVKPDTSPGGVEPADELTREAEALMALEHPHILSLYDAGRDGDTAYLVMPYIPEGSLQDALRAGPRQQLQLPLAPAEALLYIEQAASALQYAHDRNFIHRDVKPANFLIRSLSRTTGAARGTKRLHLFLADFGLSKFLAYSSNTTHLSGTPTYMAPEQFQGHAVPASDQYSLAILFYYLLTGDLPYRGSPVELMFHHLNDKPPSPASRVEGIPESLASVVQRGMAKTPEERYPSVASMAEAAREALAAAGVVVSQDSLATVAAVRPADPQTEKAPDKKPNILLDPTVALESSDAPSAATISTDDQAAARGTGGAGAKAAPANPAESSLPTMPGKSGEGSLPTLPIDEPKRPGTPPRAAVPASQERPRQRGLTIALAALAAILVIGVALGGGALLKVGPFQKNTPVAHVTRTPAATPTPTILDLILAQQPQYSVSMASEPGQWKWNQFKAGGDWSYTTPAGSIDMINVSATLTAKTFQTPLAILVDLKAQNDQEFDIVLDTTDGTSHTFYRLKLTPTAPAQAADSPDGTTFTVDGQAAAPTTTWADGNSHELVLVLDGTRLLFYLDRQALVDTHIPQPYPNAALTLASMNEAIMTAVQQYVVPQAA
jgi:serine/threonine protein kinase